MFAQVIDSIREQKMLWLFKI